MSATPDAIVMQMLPDGRRLHMRNGPIDLVVEATGTPAEITKAYQQARAAFPAILGNLASELNILRAPSTDAIAVDSIAQSMLKTAAGFANRGFVTPMICVAGAVADHILAAMTQGRRLDRAYVNNGGDIALFLAPGQTFDVGICTDPMTGKLASTTRITPEDNIQGIATSGWRGRSHSLGIADAVTVLARSAAQADAAATLIANAIDLPDHPQIHRSPANDLAPDSDLGARLVTTNVGPLTQAEADHALAKGHALAQDMVANSQIIAAYGTLQSCSFATALTKRPPLTETPEYA